MAWTGYPTTSPDFALNSTGSLTSYASWNGATEVATWELVGGNSTTALSLSSVSNSTRTGFETEIVVTGSYHYQYLSAVALNANVSHPSLHVRARNSIDSVHSCRGRALGRPTSLTSRHRSLLEPLDLAHLGPVSLGKSTSTGSSTSGATGSVRARPLSALAVVVALGLATLLV